MAGAHLASATENSANAPAVFAEEIGKSCPDTAAQPSSATQLRGIASSLVLRNCSSRARTVSVAVVGSLDTEAVVGPLQARARSVPWEAPYSSDTAELGSWEHTQDLGGPANSPFVEATLQDPPCRAAAEVEGEHHCSSSA